MALPPQFSDAVGAPIKLNVAYSWGGIYLSNSGDKTVTVEKLALVSKPDDVLILGMYAVKLPRSSTIGFLEGYTPEPLKVQGLRIEAHEDYQVVTGVRVDRAGTFLIPAVRVRYRTGGDV